MSIRSASQGIVVTMLLFALLSATADAGIMTLYSCHTPSGRPVPTAGWTPSQVIDPAPPARSINTCSAGRDGTLSADIERVTAGDVILQGWTFRAAANTEVASVSLAVCGRTHTATSHVSVNWGSPRRPQGWPAIAWAEWSPGFPREIGCHRGRPFFADARNFVSQAGLYAENLWVGVADGGPIDARPAVEVHVSSFRADIRDPSPPRVWGVHGALATSPTHAGSESVTFTAQDEGVGVFRVVAEVRLQGSGEWRQLARRERLSPTCSPLGETSHLYEFAHPQPCPLLVGDVSVEIDNASLPPGDHELRVFVEDAAGNRTDVLPAHRHTVGPTVTDVRAHNGLRASRAAQLKVTTPGRRRVSSAGAFRLGGRLLNANSEPIESATLSIQARPFMPTSRRAIGTWSRIGEVVTDADGAFSARVPAGASRSFLVTYRADPADVDPSASATANVTVRARVSVRARRSRVPNGDSAVFRGRVAGPIPPGGVPVALEVRDSGRWIPVATTRRWTRTRPSGSFTLAYRFLRTFRPSIYRFRVVADKDSAFQYARGASRSMLIRVRP
jgi:hypothetical protein